MTCQRCHGIMVEESGWGRALASDSVASLTPFHVWRCLLCGNAYDPEIARNRLVVESADQNGQRARHISRQRARLQRLPPRRVRRR